MSKTMDGMIDIEMARNILSRTIKYQMENPEKGFKNVFIHGAPAVGKSQIVREVAAEHGCTFVDVRLAGVDASAVLGLPYVWNGEQFFSTHEWFPTDGKPMLIFFDEMKNALPDTLVASFALILDRKLQNGKKLPDNVFIVAAGNMRTDKTGARELPEAMATRFAIHMVIDPATAQSTFLNYAVRRSLNPHIISYLEFRKEHTYIKGVDSFVTTAVPRTWEMLSGIMDMYSSDEYKTPEFFSAVKGCVGLEAALGFLAYMEYIHLHPDWKRVRENDHTYEYTMDSAEPAVKFGVAVGAATQLIEVVDKNPSADISMFYEIVGQLNSEMLIIFFRSIRRSLKVGTIIIRHPKFCDLWTEVSRHVK
tara:strand:+ start:500 stop:1591 length:1092 start_codon:yes stop_codon:yes gene_type:complete